MSCSADANHINYYNFICFHSIIAFSEASTEHINSKNLWTTRWLVWRSMNSLHYPLWLSDDLNIVHAGYSCDVLIDVDTSEKARHNNKAITQMSRYKFWDRMHAGTRRQESEVRDSVIQCITYSPCSVLNAAIIHLYPYIHIYAIDKCIASSSLDKSLCIQTSVEFNQHQMKYATQDALFYCDEIQDCQRGV